MVLARHCTAYLIAVTYCYIIFISSITTTVGSTETHLVNGKFGMDLGLVLQQCCRMGKKSHEQGSNTSSTNTFSSFVQGKCNIENSHNLLPIQYSNEVQHQCKLSYRICCRRHSEYRACEFGKLLALNIEKECNIVNSSTTSHIHNNSNHHLTVDLMEVSSVCCTLCRSLAKSHKSVIPCSSASRHQYLQQFGSDLSECCASPSTIENKAKMILDDTDDPLPIVRSGRAREDTFDGLIHLKSSNFTCINNSKGCVCSDGFKLSGNQCIDINECQLGIHRCPFDHRCDNTIGSFICVREATCGTGYTYNHDLKECEDNDECNEPFSPSLCPPGTICRNTRGSFRCDRDEGRAQLLSGNINNDTLLTGRMWKHKIIKVTKDKGCARGFHSPPSLLTSISISNCVDIDECVLGNHNCRPSQICINTIGSYDCLDPCLPGYIRKNSSNVDLYPTTSAIKCVDIDECSEGGHTCTSDQTCVNTEGAYKCLCRPGYMLSTDRTCMDIDECTSNEGVRCNDQTEICINTPGSYQCHCRIGFERINSQCIDIDECKFKSTPCHRQGFRNSSLCINTHGSYKCVCNSGFIMTQDYECVDIDECSIGQTKCPIGLLCVNTPGSYHCSCPGGYRSEFTNLATTDNNWSGQNDKRASGQVAISCKDIDECSQGYPCTDGSICVNTLGSHECMKIDCKSLGDGFSADPSNRNRCRRTYSCIGSSSTSSHSKGIKGQSNGEVRTFNCQEIHAFTFLSLPSNVTIPESSSRLELIALRTTKSATCRLRVTNVTVNDASVYLPFRERVSVTSNSEPEKNKYFSLIHQESLSVVRISLIRSIIGPQSIVVRVSCSSPPHELSFQQVKKTTTDIIITVSKYPF